MPSILRSRIALVSMLGAFLIPIGMSSLRGLTHVLTCEQEARTPFSIIILEDGEPTLTSSTRITREEPEDTQVCEGLSLQVSVRAISDDRIGIQVPITNTSSYPWRGTVQLKLNKLSFPVDIGEIGAGETATDTVEVSPPTGTSELNGALLIGP